MEALPQTSSSHLTVDEILPYIGEFGRFQWLLEAVFCIMIIPQTFQSLMMYFAALTPTWKCVSNSTICLLNTTQSPSNKIRCDLPRASWEYTEPAGFSIVTKFDIDCEKEGLGYLTTSMFFIGWIFGAIVLGWIADNYGRKIVFFPSTALLILSGLLTGLMPNIYAFLVFRFIAGFFKPGTSLNSFIIISELVSSTYRPFVGILLWAFFTIGLCILGMKAYFIRTYQLLFIVCTAPYLIVLLFYKFVPESIRWLQVRGKQKKAMDICKKIAKFNKKEIPTGIALSTRSEVVFNHKSNPIDIFRTRKRAISSVIQGFAWFVISMVYYGLSLAADDLGGSLYRNYVLVSMIEFPAHVVATYGCKRFGRKKTAIIPLTAGGIACILVPFIPIEGDANIARIMLGMFGKFCISITFDVIYTWSAEIYPTTIRAEGMGFLQITSRIGSASSPWVAKGLKSVHNAVPFVFMGVTSIIAAGLCMLLPETRGLPTAETVETEGHGSDERDHELRSEK